VKERIIQKNGVTVTARILENADILAVQVGKPAPNPWGEFAVVAKIIHRGVSPSDAQYIEYLTEEEGPGKAWISNSVCANRLILTAPITGQFSFEECEALEKEMNA
jgi:hypothetical protein